MTEPTRYIVRQLSDPNEGWVAERDPIFSHLGVGKTSREALDNLLKAIERDGSGAPSWEYLRETLASAPAIEIPYAAPMMVGDAYAHARVDALQRTLGFMLMDLWVQVKGKDAVKLADILQTFQYADQHAREDLR